MDDSFTKSLFDGLGDRVKDVATLSQSLTCSIEKAVSQDPDNAAEKLIEYGSNLLNEFCWLNWITCETQSKFVFSSVCAEQLASLNAQSLEKLSWDGEPAYTLCKHPLLLYLAHVILVDNSGVLGQKAALWAVRCLSIEQKLSHQRSVSLWKKISQYLELNLVGENLSSDGACEVHLESGHICLFYSQYDCAKKHFEEAQKLVNMEIELTGALGKRTRFQQSDTAQLLLKVTVPPSSAASEEIEKHTIPPKSSFPQDLRLGNETLLDHIQFSEDLETSPPLSPLQQAVVLGQCVYLQQTSPVHKLTAEETEAYVNCVLGLPQCWALQVFALFLRCRLEKSKYKTLERAMMQLQELVDFYSKRLAPEDKSHLCLFYCIPLPPHWIIEKELASVLVSAGAMQSALEVYERLEMWEEVVQCYQAVGRVGRAEEVVRVVLAKKETPTMWCLLGEVTQDPDCFRKAWELSNHRSARAQKSLGLYHLRKEMYEDAVECLQLSLQINALQEGLWFSLGCAASKIDRPDLAVKAFHQCVALEPDFAEAWNNLAAAYLRKKDKVRAFHIYQEALKWSYENWRIWENYIVVSVEIAEFEEVVRAYHRLMDVKEKFSDIEVLTHLVGAVVKGTLDRSGQTASRLRSKVGELLGRIAAQTTVSADIWKLYADYHFASDIAEDHDKGLLELQKAQRVVRLERGWERELGKLQRVVSITLQYCQACRRLCSVRGATKQSVQSLSSAKLALQGILSKTKSFGVTPSAEVLQIQEQLESEIKLISESTET